MENIKRRYEQSDDINKCRYWLVMESCSRCLFETLCHLEKEKQKCQNLPEILDFNQDQCQN